MYDVRLGNCHNESPLYNKYILITMENNKNKGSTRKKENPGLITFKSCDIGQTALKYCALDFMGLILAS
jgi:hypothetical protein